MKRKRVIVLTDRIDQRGNIANGVRVAKAFYALGYNTMIMEHGALDMVRLAEADVILACGTLIYKANRAEAATIAAIKKPDAVFILWYFDACCPQWKPGTMKYTGVMAVLPHINWLAMTDDSYPWRKHVKHYTHLAQGVDADEFRKAASFSERKSMDIIFTGGFRGAHKERGAFLNSLKSQFTVQVFGADGGLGVYDMAFTAAHQLARIVYVPPPPKVIPGPYWSNRIYLAAATGTPCVVGWAKGIEAHYKGGKEVLYFRGVDELHAAVRRLLSDVELRERIGAAGRKRTLKDHTYTNRVQTLMKEVFADEKVTLQKRHAAVGISG